MKSCNAINFLVQTKLFHPPSPNVKCDNDAGRFINMIMWFNR